MRPDSKLKERHTRKTHPENRPDVDADQANAGFEEAVFEDPATQKDKKPDPNWQHGRYGEEEREGNSADKVYDGE
jgi:hypothetical protein